MAKNQRSNNTDVIEVEAIEDNLDNTIKQELVKHNVTDAVIAELKKKFGKVKLKSVNDKQSYLEVKEARNEVRKWGILTEKICKKGREDAVAIQRKWLAKEKEVLGKIADVQSPLDADMQRYEAEQDRIEQEKIKMQEESFMQRQSLLLKYGAQYQNGYFVLDEIQYESVIVKEADDDMFNDTIAPKYKTVYERKEAARVAEEKKRFEDAEQLRAQQEEMQRQKKEFEEQQRLFKEQQEQLRQQQSEAERTQREAKDKEYKEQQEKQRQKTQARVNQLSALGLTYNMQYDSYIFEDVAISRVVEIEGMDDAKWDEMIQKVTPTIERNKKELEEKKESDRKEQIRLAEEQAAKKERDRIIEENRLAEQKRLKEEEENRIKMEQASDKMKWDHFLVGIKDIKYPDMKNATYKGKVEEAKKALIKIINL